MGHNAIVIISRKKSFHLGFFNLEGNFEILVFIKNVTDCYSLQKNLSVHARVLIYSPQIFLCSGKFYHYNHCYRVTCASFLFDSKPRV